MFRFSQAFRPFLLAEREDSCGGCAINCIPFGGVKGLTELLVSSQAFVSACPAVGLLDLCTIRYARKKTNRLPCPEPLGLPHGMVNYQLGVRLASGLDQDEANTCEIHRL